MIAGWFTPISPACQAKWKPTILALRPPPIITCERYDNVPVRVPLVMRIDCGRGVTSFVGSRANQRRDRECTDITPHDFLARRRGRKLLAVRYQRQQDLRCTNASLCCVSTNDDADASCDDRCTHCRGDYRPVWPGLIRYRVRQMYRRSPDHSARNCVGFGRMSPPSTSRAPLEQGRASERSY